MARLRQGAGADADHGGGFSLDASVRIEADDRQGLDSCAARLLSRVFPDPQGLAKSLNAFLKDLPKPEPDNPAPAPQTDADRLAKAAHDIVNTPIKRHPTTEERYQNLRAIHDEIIKGIPAKGR
jgi:hypothetical protein